MKSGVSRIKGHKKISFFSVIFKALISTMLFIVTIIILFNIFLADLEDEADKRDDKIFEAYISYYIVRKRVKFILGKDSRL